MAGSCPPLFFSFNSSSHFSQSSPPSHGTSPPFSHKRGQQEQQQILCTTHRSKSSFSVKQQQPSNASSSSSASIIVGEAHLNTSSSVCIEVRDEHPNASSAVSMEAEEGHLHTSTSASTEEEEKEEEEGQSLDAFCFAKRGSCDPPTVDQKVDSSTDLTRLEEALASSDGPQIASIMMQVPILLPKCIFLHEFIVRSGLENNVFLCSLLVSGYGKCGFLHISQAIFQKMSSRNVVTWTALVTSFVENGQPEEAFMVFDHMEVAGVVPNEITFLALINACEKLGTKEGGFIHQSIVDHGLDADVALSTALIKLYAQYGIVNKSWGLFHKMARRDVVAWTAIITAHVKQGFHKEALHLFDKMKEEKVKPNAFTFSIVLSAVEELSEGKTIHRNITEQKLNGQNVVATALVYMYGRCGSLKEAQDAFEQMSKPDSTAWTTLMKVYVENDESKEAFKIFQQMQEKRITPNAATFSIIISVCADLELIQEGREIHARIVAEGFEPEMFVENALLDLYRKCGGLDDACNLFYKMQQHDVVSWTTIMGAFMDHGLSDNVICLYNQMQCKGIEPDQAAFVYVLKASGNLCRLGEGQRIHAIIIDQGIGIENILGTSVIEMYANCGAIDNAVVVFESMAHRDATTWNTIIMAYAQEGQGKMVLELFKAMKLKKVAPTPMTFVGILSGCSQSGMVEEGCALFESINRDYDMSPSIEHYGCVVDMLGRGGYLEEAEDFIEKSPLPSNGCIWSALLGACRKHGDLERGTRAAKHVMLFEPENAAPYVLLSTIYSVNNRWDDAQKVLQTMVTMGIRKKPGCTLIDVNNEIHEFWVNDELLSKDQGIQDVLQDLENRLKEMGHVPNTNLVLHDVDKDLKEYMLGHHSERIALAFGLSNTPPGTPLRLVKNLRTCPDCHAVIKLISKIVDRKIVLRDTNRIHHFANGSCSCGDYW